jgi:NAD(P)-dependent dehydrogenase (short-subunit alcohol dehydrogenase family)
MEKSTDMRGKVCLVTGANSGIGKATALGLAKVGATVVMVCRDRNRGEAAKAQIKRESGGESVDLLVADLSSQASLRELADEFKRRYGRLDVLVNNAAAYRRERTTTADGLEAMFATNHLAPFLLTNLLLGPLRASGAARVLNITAPSTVKLMFDDLQGERRFSSLTAFGASKMGNLLFTFELARRLEGTGITVNAIHPGLVRSNLMREANVAIRFLSSLFSMPPERAAQSIVHLATAPEFAGKSGRFYRNGKEIKASAYAYDPDIGRRLWDESVRLTRLTNSTV